MPGQSWRQLLAKYNNERNNVHGLLEAYRLYQNPIYEQLVKKLGAPNVFILSAGWGLVQADYLLPNYDITFKKLKSAELYKHRRHDDKYNDFCHLRDDEPGPIAFFGTKLYLSLLSRLTGSLTCDKVLFYISADPPPVLLGWRAKRFETTARTNWHYICARKLLEGLSQSRGV